MIDPIMNLWDAAALLPIITEAGGEFFDWRGRSTVHSGESIATNKALSGAVREIVSEYWRTEISDLG
jgi:fructose-1,6-bisphosphatase/inositol monophosphatase family enzyme